MVSVIVPVFNAQNSLKNCVESILNQTYQDFEILLIDDGSTDKSYDLCEEFASKYEKVISFHTPNGGVSAARNYGIKAARGEYICFVDSDDQVAPDFLELLATPLINGEAQLSVSSLKMVILGNSREEKDEIVKYKGNFKINSTEFASLFPSGLMNPVWNKCFMKDIIIANKLTFDENRKLGEDFAFVINYCFYITSIHLIPKLLYFYYIVTGSNSLTSKIDENAISTTLETHQMLLNLPIDEKYKCYLHSSVFREYTVILRKFTNKYLNNDISKEKLKGIFSFMMHNKNVRQAYNAYKPVSLNERILVDSQRFYLFDLYLFLMKKILKR